MEGIARPNDRKSVEKEIHSKGKEKKMNEEGQLQDREQLKVMLRTVAEGQDASDAEREAWVLAVEQKLVAVYVVSLRDFVRNVLVINAKFRMGRHREMHSRTLESMFDEACDMLFGPVRWGR